MFRRAKFFFSGLLVATSVAGCSSDNDEANASARAAVVRTYSANLAAAYSDAVDDGVAFRTVVEGFLAEPTDPGLEAARTAWLESREHYMLTEGARFYGGPIDGEISGAPNYEALLNSWPLDEAYIDYTTDARQQVDFGEGTSLINTPALLPKITAESLDALNGASGDEDISSGYHAVEFLLWGQALQPVGPGERPASDYTTQTNAERRGAYLQVAVEGIVQNLTAVRDAWAEGATYRVDFEKQGDASLTKILTGLAKFSKGELGSQRIGAAYTSKERHDQHDCFSSETLVDYERNARGILAMYRGDYGGHDGPGLDELVRAADPALDQEMQTKLQASIDAIKAIPKPFEDAIAGDDDSPGRQAIQRALDALNAQGDAFGRAAKALGLTIQVDDPE